MAKQKVITYQLAYLSQKTVTLCGKHDSDEAAGVSLGPVSHGGHWGYCVICDGGKIDDRGNVVYPTAARA